MKRLTDIGIPLDYIRIIGTLFYWYSSIIHSFMRELPLFYLCSNSCRNGFARYFQPALSGSVKNKVSKKIAATLKMPFHQEMSGDLLFQQWRHFFSSIRSR